MKAQIRTIGTVAIVLLALMSLAAWLFGWLWAIGATGAMAVGFTMLWSLCRCAGREVPKNLSAGEEFPGSARRVSALPAAAPVEPQFPSGGVESRHAELPSSGSLVSAIKELRENESGKWSAKGNEQRASVASRALTCERVSPDAKKPQAGVAPGPLGIPSRPRWKNRGALLQTQLSAQIRRLA
jgi:hypothetical protein